MGGFGMIAIMEWLALNANKLKKRYKQIKEQGIHSTP
jgi:hypothetical protein